MKPTLRSFLRVTLFTLGFTFLQNYVSAQLTVDDSATPEELVTSLVGEGVTVSDITMDCPSGAFGFFECVDCNVGIGSGILLTSGSASLAVGPNNTSSATGDNGAPGDPDLDDIPGILGTNDACVLEFDLTVTSDTIRFNYSFGSEEYLEFVGSFNDAFAFYISGPGIVGSENIALIPGTATAVSINNVNTGSYPEYYVVNGDGFTAPYNTDDYYIQPTALLEKINQIIVEKSITDFFIDTFPNGMLGELNGLDTQNCKLHYVARILKWDVYQPLAINFCFKFDFAYLLEDLEPEHLDFVIEHSKIVENLELAYPQEIGNKGFKMFLEQIEHPESNDKPVEIVLVLLSEHSRVD